MSASPEHRRRVEWLEQLLARQTLDPGEPYACPYLPGRVASQVSFGLPSGRPGLYHALMDLNFRRLGPIVYRPVCAGCQACQALRVLADEFHPSRSQRRCWKRNADVRVEVGPLLPTEEKQALYARYLAACHDGQMTGTWDEFLDFLYTSHADTREVLYLAGGRLVAVCIVDFEPEALSAVYCYYDPALRARALGVFNVLWLLAECRRLGLPQLYLGYHVAQSPAMAYKAGFAPHEILGSDGTWRRARPQPTGPSPGAGRS